MTAAMPTAMPSSVRKLRRRCAVIARSASVMPSRRIIASPSASTGSIRAARRAGSTPNTSPVTIEVPSPASTAQSGANAG